MVTLPGTDGFLYGYHRFLVMLPFLVENIVFIVFLDGTSIRLPNYLFLFEVILPLDNVMVTS